MKLGPDKVCHHMIVNIAHLIARSLSFSSKDFSFFGVPVAEFFWGVPSVSESGFRFLLCFKQNDFKRERKKVIIYIHNRFHKLSSGRILHEGNEVWK